MSHTADGTTLVIGFIVQGLGSTSHAACRMDYSVRFFRLPRLVDELTRAHSMQNRSGLLKQLAKAELLVLDDLGLMPCSEQTKRDLLEILDDRYDRRSTIVTSQLPVDQWHTYLNDPTLADAILDRLVHDAYRLALKGESMRKQKTVEAKTADRTRAIDTDPHPIDSALPVSRPPTRHAPE